MMHVLISENLIDRDYIDKYNQPYPHGPVSIMSGAPGWNVKS